MGEKPKNSGREIDDQIKKAYRAAFIAGGDVMRKDLEFLANQKAHTPGDPYDSAFKNGMRVMARNFLLLGEIE